MDKATFDLFDASLGDSFTYWQGLPDDVRFSSYRRVFSVDPINWSRHLPPNWALRLDWHEYRYSKVQERSDLRHLIHSTLPGIYIFYVRPERLIGRFPQFALYVGISNERDSQRPLRERLGDYLPERLSAIKKRKNIHQMLQLYYRHVWVSYAVTPATSADLEALEDQLHGYIHPCFGRRDFPVEVKTQQQAWGQI